MEFSLRDFKYNYLLDQSTMVGKQRVEKTLLVGKDGLDTEAFRRLKEIQDNIYEFVTEGNNLLIYSEFTGNGKTEWAKKLIFSWFESIWFKTDLTCRGIFISLPRFINAMKSNINTPNEYFRYINSVIRDVDLVIWDELNYKELVSGKSTFEHDYLLDVISYRHSIGKSNIYTSNYNLENISANLGTRLSSRIIGESVNIEFKGADKRSWGVGK